MTVHHRPTARTDRATMLRAGTHTTHEALDKAIMAARPFDSIGNYSRFLMMQHAFHQDVAPLYRMPALVDLIPDLAGRARLEAVVQDLADLGIAPAEEAASAAACEGIDIPEALGWLYVVEGSNLGAAFLFKAALKMGLSASHGARHLAEAPEGRAPQWRAFKEALDAVPLSEAEDARAIAGAAAAFARVRGYVSTHLA